jgi:hypothetical protein
MSAGDRDTVSGYVYWDGERENGRGLTRARLRSRLSTRVNSRLYELRRWRAGVDGERRLLRVWYASRRSCADILVLFAVEWMSVVSGETRLLIAHRRRRRRRRIFTVDVQKFQLTRDRIRRDCHLSRDLVSRLMWLPDSRFGVRTHSHLLVAVQKAVILKHVLPITH